MDVIPAWLVPYVPAIRGTLIALGIFIGGWIAAKWANRLTRRAFGTRKIDEALGRFIASIAQYTVLAAAVITALGAVGIQTTSLVAVFASAGLAIGLALQGSLGSFASGVMILFFRPFNLKDKVTVGGHTGCIDDIGLFATTLITADNETIIVPNSAVTSGSIINFTRRGTLRGAVTVGLAYGTDVGKALVVLTTAAEQTKLVLKDPAPAVAFAGLGARTVDFTVLAWSTADDYLAMLHNLRRSIYEALAAAGIQVPVNQIVLQQLQAAAN
ncbi:MAG TPA: mechanosensitive ion channel domain-containing protein [Kofleriaceae bacterium]|nr:mechanosensitive ion channel domain-containing protein [Kofleriaceae bacterium]